MFQKSCIFDEFLIKINDVNLITLIHTPQAKLQVFFNKTNIKFQIIEYQQKNNTVKIVQNGSKLTKGHPFDKLMELKA